MTKTGAYAGLSVVALVALPLLALYAPVWVFALSYPVVAVLALAVLRFVPEP
jgi:hypothetical protein